MAKVKVFFSVEVEIPKGYSVHLAGDDPKLGAWDPLAGVHLTRKDGDQNLKMWTCSVDLTVDKRYCYRYYVCKEIPEVGHHNRVAKDNQHNGHSEHGLSLLKWETNVNPRVLSTHGVECELELPVATFGCYDNATNIGRGWLINQNEIHVRLHNNPIHMYSGKHKEQVYSVRCVAMDYGVTQESSIEEEDSVNGPSPCSIADIFVCNLGEEDCQPKEQGTTGVVYNPNDYVVFRTQLAKECNVGFQLEFYLCEANKAPSLIGCADLLPFDERKSQCKAKLPIISSRNNRPIGEVLVDLLLVSPLPGVKFNLESSPGTIWNGTPSKTLDVGHRGLGSSFGKVNTEKENTIASFAAARKHGADMVELDVLLTKDKQSVIYHDYAIKVLCENRKSEKGKDELYEIPVKDLTLSQLKSLKMFATSHGSVELDEDCVGGVKEDESRQSFPTLEHCLRDLDMEIGLDIEIKYPLEDINDVWEMENFIDVNENLDYILPVVLKHAGNRRIVFSCFDPDTCIALQLKQNKYPVLLLHQGESHRYVPYKDYRGYSFKSGIRFALSEQLSGLALLSEVLLRDLSIVEDVMKKNLLLFVWGNENNDPGMIQKFRDLKINGVIYDRMDLNRPENQSLSAV